VNRKERRAVVGIMAMLLQLLVGTPGRNQRRWQTDWNRHADVLDGRVPHYPKKLVR